MSWICFPLFKLLTPKQYKWQTKQNKTVMESGLLKGQAELLLAPEEPGEPDIS